MNKTEIIRLLEVARDWYNAAQNYERKHPIQGWLQTFYEYRDELLPECKDINLNKTGIELLFMHLTSAVRMAEATNMIEKREKDKQTRWNGNFSNSNIPQVPKPNLRLIV